MSGRAPRTEKIRYPEKTVTISGTFDENYGYATVRATKYTAAATVSVEKNSRCSVYVSSSTSDRRPLCTVTFNGETVKSGYCEYKFSITADTTIKFTKSGSSSKGYYWICAITTS